MRVLLVASLLFTTAAMAAAPDELLGLWKAKRRFGPDARGTLVMERDGGADVAEIAGRVVPVRIENGEMLFELPGDQGSFRGRLRDGAIAGHWIEPKGQGQNADSRFVSPVRLEPDGARRWIGRVMPFDDDFTFYLLLRQRPDGTIGAFLRNPERDFGAQQGVEQLVRDGNALRLVGRSGDVATGSYDPARGVMTLVFPTRGGAYDFTRDGDDSDFYPRGKNPARYQYRPPLPRADGWPTGPLEEANIDRAGIEQFIRMIVDTPEESVDTPEIHGILVARGGKLVLEEYFHGQHRDKLHDTRSAAKSITATIAGAAIHAGVPVALSTPVYRVMNGGEFPAELEPRKRAMTLEHLLTMSGGYFCDDTNPDAPGGEEIIANQEEEPDYYRFTLRVPMAYDPGEKAVYCSASPNLALGMVGRAAGESPLDLFDRLLARPMQIERYAWPRDPAGNPYGGGSVQILPRDFMKFGQLMLNGGTWKGRRLLSRDFVARTSAPLYHLRGITYGYLWWGIEFPYKDRTVRGFFAGGAGGQAVMVIPALDLVVATFAGNYSSKGAVHTQQELIPRYILPAVRETGDDKRAPVAPREFKTPYGPSPDGSRIVPEH